MARRRRNTNPPEEVVEAPLEQKEEIPSAEPAEVVVEEEVQENAEEVLAVGNEPDFGSGPSSDLRRALFERGQRFLDLLTAAQQELTPENVHQLRVSSRRLGAALEMVASLLGPAPVRKLHRQLKKARKALGPLRDLQRQLEWLSDEPLLDDYLTERSGNLTEFVRKGARKLIQVRPSKAEKRLEMLDALLAALMEEEQSEDCAREILARCCWESLLEAMALADEVDPDHSFSYHPLRVAFKNFRYQAEFFSACGYATVLDQHDGWARIKELHDALGHLQDLEVLCCHLDFHWAQFPPVRESQARVINRLLKERLQTLGHIKLQDLEWEGLWEWPEAEEEEIAEESGED